MASDGGRRGTEAGARGSTPAIKKQVKYADLHFALFTAIANGRYRQTKLLIEAGVDVNCADEYATSPLVACFAHVRDLKRLSRLVRLLLESGADPNSRDGNGRTAIMHAAMLNLTDILTLLLDQRSINLELQDNDGNTVLMHAAGSGNCQSVSILLKYMGRLRQVLHLTQKNNQSYTAVELAERNGHYDVVSMLGGSDRPPPLSHPGQLERGPTPVSPLQPHKHPQRKKTLTYRRRPSREVVHEDWPSIVDDHPRAHPSRSFPSLIRTSDPNASVSSTESNPAESGRYNQMLNQLDVSIKKVQNTFEETDDASKATNRNSQTNSYFPPIRPLKKECRSIIVKHTER